MVGFITGLKRRRSLNRATAQAAFLNRGSSVASRVGAVVLVSEAQGEKAAAALYSVALHAVSTCFLAACV